MKRSGKARRRGIVLPVAIMLLMAAVLMTACGGPAVPERLIGEWQCDSMASDQVTETGFYKLRIDEDGAFSLYDAEAGNPGISGTMNGDDTGKIGILELSCDDADFDPPSCWVINKECRLRYKILDNKTIRLGYSGVWLTFRK